MFHTTSIRAVVPQTDIKGVAVKHMLTTQEGIASLTG